MAMRMPISRVRSVTDTSMMFMMPMPPTSSEIAPIRPSSMATPALIVLAVSANEAMFCTLKSSGLSRRMRWRARRVSLTSSSASLSDMSGRPWAAM